MRLPVEPKRVALDFLPKRGAGAEIGVHTGNTSQQILRLASPRAFHLIDPWRHVADPAYARAHYGGEKVDQSVMDERYEGVRRRFAAEIEAGTVNIIRSDSAGAAGRFADGELDFVYIDGDHSYDAVKADLELYYPKVKKGGLILADDYEDGRWWGRDVIRACNEFLAARPVEVAFKLGVYIGIRV